MQLNRRRRGSKTTQDYFLTVLLLEHYVKAITQLLLTKRARTSIPSGVCSSTFKLTGSKNLLNLFFLPSVFSASFLFVSCLRGPGLLRLPLDYREHRRQNFVGEIDLWIILQVTFLAIGHPIDWLRRCCAIGQANRTSQAPISIPLHSTTVTELPSAEIVMLDRVSSSLVKTDSAQVHGSEF